MTHERPVALITGGTRGIGLGIAKALAGAGWTPVLSGRRPEAEVQAVIEELRGIDSATSYVPADVSDPGAREAMLAEIRERFGRLDVLVNNAGIPSDKRGDLLEATEASFERVMRVNVQGPYFLTQSVARWMLEQKAQHPDHPMTVVNVSSVSATLASHNRGDYCISKAAVSMATQVWASYLGPHGVSVFELRPGIVKTDMTAKVQDDYQRRIQDTELLLDKRWGTPEDMGRAVVAMARGDLPYSVGQVITLDGGMSLGRL